MTFYERIKAPRGGELLFAPLSASATSGLTLTVPNGGYHFDAASVTHPPPPPPPPPPNSDFQTPVSGWKSALQIPLRGLSALPGSLWAYGGAPGGTSGCLWNKSQITFDADGAVFTTQWNGSDWLTAGVGTQFSIAAPFMMVVKEKTDDANIEGENEIDLDWGSSPSSWPSNVEVDFWERAIKNGAWQPATARLHYGSSNSTTPPITAPSAEDFGWHFNGVSVTQSAMTIYQDGVSLGSSAVPASAWSALSTIPHWLGVQSQLYSVGTGDKTKTSVRHICSLEFLVPA